MLQDRASALAEELDAARAEAREAEERARRLDDGMSKLISDISDERERYANRLKEAESEISRRSSLADKLAENLRAAEKRAAQAEDAVERAALDAESTAVEL